MSDEKRLFFAFTVEAPWPDDFPHGRVLDKENRHMTLAFLGNISLSKVRAFFSSIPVPPFIIGPAAKFDEPLFLPKREPHVVAWHVHFLEKEERILSYQKELLLWLLDHNLIPEISKSSFLPHATIARGGFDRKEWIKSFRELPLFIKSLELYESLGNSEYRSLWKKEFIKPFEEIEHTGDIAFYIRGETYQDLHLHAQIALFFTFPSLLPYFSDFKPSTLDEIIMDLNEIVRKADMEIGSPIKAVSFHADMIKREDNLLEWEMILDV